MNLYPLIKPLLFRLDPEQAHHLTLHLTSLMPELASFWDRPLAQILESNHLGLSFSSPLGLAAGLDKNAQSLAFFSRLGFGGLECGTVTVKPQIGNAVPRMFRYPEEYSLRNSMGFPNNGASALLEKIRFRSFSSRLGVNIGKSKEATSAEAITEYRHLYELFAPHADWITVNISSPNTQGLRDLQNSKWLENMMAELLTLRKKIKTPVLVKLSPDMNDEELKLVTESLVKLGVDGIIATNTTLIPERGFGGVSGRLLRVKAHQKRKMILDICNESQTPVIGVGGIESFKDVQAFWAAGGSLFQIYTAFVYHGPGLVAKLHSDIETFLNRGQMTSLDQFFKLSRGDRQKYISQYGQS